MSVQSQTLLVHENNSEPTFDGILWVSVQRLDTARNSFGSVSAFTTVTVGCIGSNSAQAGCWVGDVVKLTASDGTHFEARLLGIDDSRKVAKLLVTRVMASDVLLRGQQLVAFPSLASAGKTGAEDSPFSQAEIADLKAKISSLEAALLEQFAKTTDDAEFVRRKLSYLIDGLQRFGRVDWYHVAAAVIVTLATQLVVSAANNDSFWKLVQDVLQLPMRPLL